MNAQEQVKTAPANQEAEKRCIGACLIDSQAADAACELLRPEDFHIPSHRLMFQIIAEMRLEGRELDTVSIADTMAQQRPSNSRAHTAEVYRDTLDKYLTDCPSAANVEEYCKLIRSESERRDMFELAIKLRQGLETNRPVDEMLEDATVSVDRIYDRRLKIQAEPQDLHTLAVPIVRDILENPPRAYWGLPTGIKTLDDHLGGMQRGTYVVLAARASMGKSTFAYAIARGIRERNPESGKPLIISNEMNPTAIARCGLASEAGLSQLQLLKRTLGQDQRERLYSVLNDGKLSGIQCVYMGGATVNQIKAVATRHQRKHGLPLLIVDLAGRLRGHGEGEYERLSGISRGLQALAGQLQCCLIACVQVSRAAVLNKDHVPGLQDLKGTGSWEEDADQVVFLHRPTYHDPNSHDTSTHVIIAKDRTAGQVGTVRLQYSRATGRFDTAA